jgi:hypothetical protein
MKKILFTTIVLLLSINAVNAQKEKKAGKWVVRAKLKEGVNPKIYVDGKVFDFPMELIDQEKIASILVVEGEQAIKKYNAPNGVVLIKTKSIDKSDISEIKINANSIAKDKKIPKVIINGKVSDKKTLDKLNPNDIEKMEVFKGEQAIKKYNSPNGVIIITTKKK